MWYSAASAHLLVVGTPPLLPPIRSVCIGKRNLPPVPVTRRLFPHCGFGLRRWEEREIQEGVLRTVGLSVIALRRRTRCCALRTL